jgi:hypothetical protein
LRVKRTAFNLRSTVSAHAGTIAVRDSGGCGEVTTMTVDEIMREALALDAETRASMAHELLSSLESLSEDEVERLWIEEARRRSADVKVGRARSVPADDSIARARARR